MTPWHGGSRQSCYTWERRVEEKSRLIRRRLGEREGRRSVARAEIGMTQGGEAYEATTLSKHAPGIG
jgi:hypothetical protein